MQVYNRSRRKTEWDEQLIMQVLQDDFAAYGIRFYSRESSEIMEGLLNNLYT